MISITFAIAYAEEAFAFAALYCVSCTLDCCAEPSRAEEGAALRGASTSGAPRVFLSSRFSLSFAVRTAQRCGAVPQESTPWRRVDFAPPSGVHKQSRGEERSDASTFVL